MDELYHHGVKGMKWGVRRYQNADGSLTPKGKKRAIKDSKTYWGKEKKHQPSSYKSSILAELYSATNSEFIRKKLDKSNDSDAVRWISAHYIGGTPINEISKFDTTLGKEKVNKLLKKWANNSTKTASEAKQELDSKIRNAFKKHPKLYDEFGGPDQVDDVEYLALVMMGYGYDGNIDF